MSEYEADINPIQPEGSDTKFAVLRPIDNRLYFSRVKVGNRIVHADDPTKTFIVLYVDIQSEDTSQWFIMVSHVSRPDERSALPSILSRISVGKRELSQQSIIISFKDSEECVKWTYEETL